MLSRLYIPISVVASLFLGSCASDSLSLFKPPKIVNPNELKEEEVSDELAQGVDALGASGATGRFEATFTNEDVKNIESSIVWAPIDPEEQFQLGVLGTKEDKHKTWTKNYKKAIAAARQQGKPLLIWFSDSRGSAISNRLSNELFSRSDFDSWVRDNFSTLLVDKAIDTAVNDDSRVNRLKAYYERMTSRFSVKGTPEVLVVDVNGEVHARYRGYTKGEADFYWGRLKIARENAAAAYGGWREKLEKKGYRMWHSLDNQTKVFARMANATEEKVILVTPEGKRYTEEIKLFSQSDQRWVEQHRKSTL